MKPFLQKLRSGQPTIGGWISFASSYVAELLANAGFDWVVVDAEHGVVNPETLQSMLQAIHAQRVPAFVRLPESSPLPIKRALDAGADGIIAPMVLSAEHAEAVVTASRFPPVGRRSVGLGRWRFMQDDTHPPAVNDEVAVIVMIEHRDAVEAIDDILAVPGIDAIFVGPTDLGASLGYDSRQVERAIETIVASAGKHDIAAGIHLKTPEQALERIRQGFRFIALSEAGRMIQRTTREFLQTIRDGSTDSSA